MKGLLRAGVLTLAVMLVAGAAPTRAAAQNGLNVNSSMSARCLDVSCTLVEFVLDVEYPSPIFVSWFAINSKGTGWSFNAVESIVDMNGNPIETTWIVANQDLRIENYGIGPDPLTIVVSMATTDQENTLNMLTYAGMGNEDFNHNGQVVVFEGSVAPEPISVVLLGSGLAGLAGVAARRKRRP